MEYCDCSSMALSYGVNLYGFKDLYLVWCMNVSSHKHQCIGRMVLLLQSWPQDLPRGGA